MKVDIDILPRMMNERTYSACFRNMVGLDITEWKSLFKRSVTVKLTVISFLPDASSI